MGKTLAEEAPNSELLRLQQENRELKAKLKQSQNDDITGKASIKDRPGKLSGEIIELLEDIPSAIYHIDFRGPKFTMLNDSMCHYSGYTREELLGKNPFDLMDDKSKLIFKERLQKMLAGERIDPNVVYTVIAKDGTRYFATLNMKFTYDGDKAAGALVIAQDITKRKLTEEKNELQNALLDGINRIFKKAISCDTEEELGKTCLNVAQELTGSKFGYIDEVNTSGYLDNIAISDPGWSVCTMPDSMKQASLSKNLYIRGIRGRVILDGEPLFTNDPASHPEMIALPEGHPPIKAFLEVPLIQSGMIIGMVGLGNKENGYNNQDVYVLETLAVAIVQALMRKRAELAVKESEQHLGELVRERTRELEESRKRLIRTVESITDAFFTLDREWRITYWNKAAEDIFNIPREKILARVLWEVFPDLLETDIYNHACRSMDENVPVAFELAGIYTGRWFEASAYPSEDGLTVYLHDINERKQLETELLQSEEKFSKAFNGIPIMMTLATVNEGRYIDCNEALCLKIGYTREEIIGRSSKELNLFTDLDFRKRPGHVKRLIRDGKIENLAIDIRTKSGEVLNCLFWSQLIHLDGETCHITGLVDVTEQKHLEKEIRRLDRLNLIGEMAASIGHEIRNPMTAIRGFLQMLSSKPVYTDDLVYFDLMIEELDRANDIISEYLGMAKNKKVDLQYVFLDLIIKSIYPMIQSDANHREIRVKLDLNKPPQPLIDENEIRQLILNLTRNGLEAMSAGGTLSIGTTTEGSDIVLYVKDEGQGLPSEVIDRLGTPFVTTKDNGTGLGLAVCYSIAVRHKATIHYQTGPSGTTFYVRFPIPMQQQLALE